MKHVMHGTLADNAAKIKAIIEGEERSWIPSKGVENYVPLGQQPWETNWWFVAEDTDKYIYLNRDDWYDVTIQRCKYKDLTYYMVYVEHEKTDSSYWFPQGLVTWTQSTCHTFRWVRSLRHAMKLGEYWWELMLWLANPEEYFLTQDEWNNGKQN